MLSPRRLLLLLLTAACVVEVVVVVVMTDGSGGGRADATTAVLLLLMLLLEVLDFLFDLWTVLVELLLSAPDLVVTIAVLLVVGLFVAAGVAETAGASIVEAGSRV